jgi:hypothetical protein
VLSSHISVGGNLKSELDRLRLLFVVAMKIQEAKLWSLNSNFTISVEVVQSMLWLNAFPLLKIPKNALEAGILPPIL